MNQDMNTSQGPPSVGGTGVDLGFGGLSVAVGDHTGHFYRNQEEMIRVLVPYFIAGLGAGDKCTLFCQAPTRERVMNGLEAQGIEVQSAIDSGQFLINEGMDSADAAMEVFSNLIKETKAAGYRMIRNAGDMSWGLAKMPSTDELVKWEAFYDLHVATQFPLVALCQYDLKAFGGDVVLDALKTHPLCIIGELVHKNPFYVSPQEFLEELAGRPGRI